MLASASPRRRELLARLGVPFTLRPAGIDESPLPGEAPERLAVRLALAKARAAARDAPAGSTILGADTVVALDGELLAKPADAAEARSMLGRLSGREHEVWTGVAVVGPDDAERSGAQCTRVRFRTLGAAEIARYAASGEPLDKAGGYAIQGGAAAFVESVDGDTDNVVGLPLGLVVELLGLSPVNRRT